MRKVLSFIVLMSIALGSCKKDKGGEEADSIAIELNASEVRPLQILSIDVEGVSVQNAIYNGAIGGVEVEFHPSNENAYASLVCLVPENVGTGIQTLTINLDGQDVSGSVTVLTSETIGTPEDVFDQFYADYTTASYVDFIDETGLQDALDVLRGLSESERLVAAQMLANNRVVLDEIAVAIADAEAQTGLGFGKTQSCDMLCAIGTSAALVGTFLSAPIVSAVGLGVLVGYVARALRPVITALWNKLVGGLTSAISLGYDRMAYVTDLVYDEANQMISNKVEEVPDTIYLENGSPLKLAIKTVREPLISENNREEYAEVGSFLDMYYRLQNFLVGTEYQVPGLETGEVEDFALDLDDFSISVDNPLVTASEITGTPELAEVSFDSPQDGAHIFNFTYSYVNDEGTSSSFTQTARLLNISEFANWSGAGANFADTDPRSVDGSTGIMTSNGLLERWYNFDFTNWWQVNDPAYTGTFPIDKLYFRIIGYDGPGVYSIPDLGAFPLQGVSDVTMWSNVHYNNSTLVYPDNSDYCIYENGGFTLGFTASVNITGEEWIGDNLVLEGDFSITILEENSYYDPSSCTVPATFTGDFRVSAEDD